MMQKSVGCFAVETLRLMEEASEGDFGLGISVAGIAGTHDGLYDQFFLENSSDVERLARALNSCDRLVGYGIRGFDLRVLITAIPRSAVLAARTIDMLEEVERVASKRVSLSNLCRETLGRDLPMAGIQSPLEWRAGNRGAVARRLHEKLEAVRDLYILSVTGGELCFLDGSEGGFKPRRIRLDLRRLLR